MSVIPREAYAVYLVTDDPSRYAGDFVETVERALAHGVTLVQYRDTESDGPALYARCKRLKEMLDARGVPLVVNNRADLALAVRAAGVHVGHGDLPPEAVRRAVGDSMDIGVSARNAVEAAAVRADVADAVGIGPVFDARATKADASDAIGLAGLRIALSALPRKTDGSRPPAVAIGGINAGNVRDVMTCGVDGFAAVSMFSRM